MVKINRIQIFYDALDIVKKLKRRQRKTSLEFGKMLLLM